MEQLVSILIPAYNASKWLTEAVDSALAQTWPNKEIIIVDDGSNDDTLSIARGYEGAAVRVLTQPNSGAARARNHAIRFARGDYIQWLDADDILHPDKIAAQMEGAESGLRSRTLMTAAWGRFFSDPTRARFARSSLCETLDPVEWIVRKFRDNTFMFPASWLVSRRLTELAGNWDERLTLDDDGEYMCRLVSFSDSVRFVPSALCWYRIGNASSLSWRASDQALESAYLSMTLSIARLLELINDSRTRTASLRFIQATVSELFLPERDDLVQGCHALAHSLGGTIVPPHEQPHFRVFRKVFGWHAAKAVRTRIAQSRLVAARVGERVRARLPMTSEC